MRHIDITRALVTLRPGAEWALDGESLSGITWLDKVQTRPTDGEIMSAIAAYVPPPSVEYQIAALQAQVAALLAAQGK